MYSNSTLIDGILTLWNMAVVAAPTPKPNKIHLSVFHNGVELASGAVVIDSLDLLRRGGVCDLVLEGVPLSLFIVVCC